MKMVLKELILICLSLLNILQCDHAKKVAMKVVEEPSTFGMNSYNAQSVTTSLIPRIKPSNFSGPPHLERLRGRCLETVIKDYKYEVCPFANVTQHEQSLRWNPYSGILGIWSEWEIENNTFVAMVMREGDSCGSLYRSVKVFLDCGNMTSVVSAAEPDTCQYEVHMTTPLSCHPDSMLVYPTLSLQLQKDWDLIESQLAADLITKKGYRKRLQTIFEKAGYVLTPAQKTELSKAAAVSENKETADSSKHESLDKCQTEYEKLQKEVDALKSLLESHGIKNNVSKSAEEAAKPPVFEDEPLLHDDFDDDLHLDNNYF